MRYIPTTIHSAKYVVEQDWQVFVPDSTEDVALLSYVVNQYLASKDIEHGKVESRDGITSYYYTDVSPVRQDDVSNGIIYCGWMMLAEQELPVFLRQPDTALAIVEIDVVVAGCDNKMIVAYRPQTDGNPARLADALDPLVGEWQEIDRESILTTLGVI